VIALKVAESVLKHNDDDPYYSQPDKYWATRGYNSRNPSVCDTFTSSAARVQ
jgi:hypothetical protein